MHLQILLETEQKAERSFHNFCSYLSKVLLHLLRPADPGPKLKRKELLLIFPFQRMGRSFEALGNESKKVSIWCMNQSMSSVWMSELWLPIKTVPQIFILHVSLQITAIQYFAICFLMWLNRTYTNISFMYLFIKFIPCLSHYHLNYGMGIRKKELSMYWKNS